MSTTDSTKRATTADIAREVGVSRATVGFVLNATPGQTISAGTRDKVLAAAERLGYRPHLAAQALASGKNRIVLLVLPEWPIEYSMTRHLEEASLVLDAAGYSLVTMTPHPGGRARPLWQTLQPDVVMGMVPFTDEQLREIRASGVTNITPGAEADDTSLDRALFSQGPRLQVDHLVTNGRRLLAFASSPDPRLESLVASRRRVAVNAAVQADIHPLRVKDVYEENASQVVAEWHAAGINGVVAYNDEIAALVVGAALRLGLKVPEQLAVVGHDDSPLARLLLPSLSSIHTDNVGLGRYFAEIALSAAEGRPAPSTAHEPKVTLVHRESS